MILFSLAEFEAHDTTAGLTESRFIKATQMKYLTVCIIILLVDLKLQNKDFLIKIHPYLNYFPLMGTYEDINQFWYFKVGVSITLTMMINIFSHNAASIFSPLISISFRVCDRGCKRIKKTPEEDISNDECNTGLTLQYEIQNLYTGPEMLSYSIFAASCCTFWAIMTFSPGMPLLYPAAFLTFLLEYLIQKMLFLNFYQKTTHFHSQLPLDALKYM